MQKMFLKNNINLKILRINSKENSVDSKAHYLKCRLFVDMVRNWPNTYCSWAEPYP